ncbi:hypothetical protein TKK_0003963 [Trichogramma kaykai]
MNNNTINLSRVYQEPAETLADRLRESFMAEADHDNIMMGHYNVDRVNKSSFGQNLEEGEHWMLYYVFFSLLVTFITALHGQWVRDNERERRAARQD